MTTAHPGWDAWSYPADSNLTTGQTDLAGYHVEATDGSIGKIDEATYEVGSSYVVVDTGPWIFGSKVMLPAGVITRVDPDDEKVYVNLTKDQIKDAPKFDPDRRDDDVYRKDLGGYYGSWYPGAM